jgi:hypothetical protein
MPPIMRRILTSAKLAIAPLLLIIPALAQESAAPSLGQFGVSQVEVLHGRASLFTPLAGLQTPLRGTPMRVIGRAHLEVPPGSEVRVSWLGHASLHIWGPTALEWSPSPTRSTPKGLPLAAPSGVHWTLFDLAWMDIEVRRGDHVLRLPGDWRLDLRPGTLHLRGLPSGPVELRHQAGRVAWLRWLGDASQARPPMAIYPGSTLRIDRPLPARREVGPQAEAWPSSNWPWRAPQDTPAERAERQLLTHQTTRFEGYPTQDASQAGPVNTVSGFADPTAVSTTLVEDGASPQEGEVLVLPAPTGPKRTAIAPLTGAPAVQLPRPETAPVRPPKPGPLRDSSPGEEAAPPAFDPAHWRGLERSQLTSAGALGVEARADVEVRVFASGRYKVIVDALSKEGAWCFGPDRDWRLEPGAVAVYEADGSLKLSFGKLSDRAPVRGRPSFSDLAD